MKNTKELKKIGVSIFAFIIMCLIVSYPMETKINALEKEKVKLTEENDAKYKGDCSDDDMDYSEDIVIKIIEKMDPNISIKFVNKFDITEENSSYSNIELSVSGDLDKIKDIEEILKDLKLNYKIENMEIKNPLDEKGNKQNYVDCIMTFKVI